MWFSFYLCPISLHFFGVLSYTCTYLRNGHKQEVWRMLRSRDRDHTGQHGETLSLLKIQKKISWVWWRMPVIPATQEAEAGELPEPRRWRLRLAKIAPFHSSLGNKSKTPSKKKKKKSLAYSIPENLIISACDPVLTSSTQHRTCTLMY
uniref:Uncharacterized protein n=1 Tax=Callithrix jacchus TaxID=9483 RepID=A0A8I3WX90_CALJA